MSWHALQWVTERASFVNSSEAGSGGGQRMLYVALPCYMHNAHRSLRRPQRLCYCYCEPARKEVHKFKGHR